MSNTTFRDIQDNALAQVSKSDAVTRGRIKNNINMGYQNFVLRELWPFREKTDTLTTIGGTQEYTLLTEFPDIDENNILSVALQGDQFAKLVYKPFNQLRVEQPDFDYQAAGIPTIYYLRGGKIGFWPTPQAAYTVEVDYYMIPTELDADADEPIIPIAYREALMQYAISLEQDRDDAPDLAIKAMNAYEQILTLARQNLLSQPNDDGSFVIRGPLG